MKLNKSIAAVLLASTVFATGVHAEDGVTELKWQMWTSTDDEALFQQVADLVNQKYPDIKVTLESTGLGEYVQRLPVQIASGDLADIVSLQSSRVPTFADLFEPLGPYIEESGLDLNSYDQAALASYQFDGEQLLFPYDTGPVVLYLNAKLFEDAGVPLPEENWTIDEFREAAKKLKTDDKWGYALQWTDLINGASAQGVSHLDENNKIDLMNPEFIAAAKNYIELVTVDGSGVGFTSGSDAVAPYARYMSGDVAMYQDGPWMLQWFKSEVDFPIAFAEVPLSADGKPGEFATAGSGYGIYKDSEHKEEAFKALEVMTGPEAGAILANAARALPGNVETQTLWFDNGAADIPSARPVMEKELANAAKLTAIPESTQFQNLMEQYVPLIFTGDKTVEEAFQQIQDELY